MDRDIMQLRRNPWNDLCFERQRHGRLRESAQQLIVKSGAIAQSVALAVKRRTGHQDEIDLVKSDRPVLMGLGNPPKSLNIRA